MKPHVSLSLLMALAVLVSGCVETKDAFTINPDGSGKVRHEALFAPTDLKEKSTTPPEEELKAAIRKELEKSEGIDAWTDVTFERQADGKIKFAGTAYFPALAKLKFHNNGFKASTLVPRWTPAGNGRGVLELQSKEDEAKKEAAPEPVALTEEELAAKLTAAKAQYEQMKPMMAAVVGSMKTELTFRLPGTVTEQTNFKRDDAGNLQIGYTGAQMLAVMDKMFADEARLRQMIKEGRNLMKDGPKDELLVNKELFGTAAPVRAVVSVSKAPLFDYAAEVAAARVQMPALFKSVGTVPPVPVAPAGSGEIKSLTVGGIRWVKQTDETRDIRPFNWSSGYTVSLIAELPGAVLKVTEGLLEKAVARDGTNLLPAREWDRKIHFPNLSKDKAAAVFEVNLGQLPEGVTGFQEIAGSLTYLVGSTTKTVELGFASLVPEAVGKELDARIQEIKPSRFQKDKVELELKLACPREMVKEVVLRDADGKILDTEIGGYSDMNKQVKLTLRVPGAVPGNGSIAINLYDDLKEFTAPFQLRNIDLLGNPAK
jgi:hypothetical protein